MPYCTIDDLIKRYGERELIQRSDRDNTGEIDNTIVQQAIDDGADEIDSYLTQYTLPLATVPVLLVRLNCDIARFNLYQDFDDVSAVKTRYDKAVQLLRAIAKGDAKLNVSVDVAPVPDQTVIVAQGPERVFKRRG